MAQVPKYERVSAVIERRVRNGDYLLQNIPGERRIAEETGVSYMTARRAVTELLNRHVLIRRHNGALDVHPRYIEQNAYARVVLLYPAYPSPHLARLRLIVSEVLEEQKMTLRPVQFVHWDDPIVLDALGNPGGALFIPAAEDIPPAIVSNMRASKVAVLDRDVSEEGIPSIELFPDAHVMRVFDHLHRLGHRKIDCISTQHGNPEIERRIVLWRHWLEEHGCQGQLWDDPARSFTDPTPHAHRLAGRLIDQKLSKATALVCTTFPAALGAVRACWERGLDVGRDIAICSINIEPPARFCCPSITGLDMPDLSAVLNRCVKWFCDDRPWRGRTLLTPPKPEFFVGESTGQPAKVTG
jgi:DNA-binding LacI/PurR family transcriptional regulator